MQFKHLSLLGLSAVIVFSLISTGCKKSNDSNSGSGSITATVSGTNFSPTSTTAWYSTDSAIFEIGAGSLKAQDTSIFAITFAPPFTINTVLTDINDVTVDYYHNGNDYFSGYGVGSGHVAMIVTALDTVNHKISGTFTAGLYNFFNDKDSVVVTNGKFNTSYIVQP